MSPTMLSYRREIDGLRAVAVLPVILFHAGFQVFSGGFVGVDVFFVISGYLITTIILREQREGRFSIITFYERRARRILPALSVVMLACVPFALAWMLPAQLRDFGQSLAAVSLFSSNILFWVESGYFDSAAELKPLLHTWSLAVEEQYYVLFPLMLLALRRRPLRDVAVAVGLLAVLSLILSEWAWRNEASANFYMLPTRAWELLAGSILAVYLMGRERPAGWRSEAGAGLGLAMIAGAILLFDKATPFPSLLALVPVVGSVLVILCADSSNWTGRFLGWKPMVGVGLISYSAYLWHQPLFAFARIRSIETPTLALMAGLAALALLLAWVTWRFVEAPFRDRARVSRRRIFAGAAASLVIFGSIAVALEVSRGLPQRLDPEILRLAAFDEPYNPRFKNCVKVAGEVADYCVFNPELDQRVALWGDSHAAAIAGPLAAAFAAKGYGLTNLTRPGCAPIPGIWQASAKGCSAFKAAAEAYLTSDSAPDTVILLARWAQVIDSVPFDNQEGGLEIDDPKVYFPIGGSTRRLTQADLGAAARASVEALLCSGKRVVLVGNIPEAGWDVPQVLTKMTMFGGSETRPLTTSMSVFRARDRSTQMAFGALGARPRLVRIEPSLLFCDRQIAGRCINEWAGSPLYRDDDHLNGEGARWLATQIAMAVDGATVVVPRDPTPASPCPRR